MQNPLKISIPRKSRTSGFTLVEMLVAVSLVLLIMLLLAEIFSLAAGSALKQKGTAENDQQARTFTTIIQGDICARSFRKVIPFHPLPAPPSPLADVSGNFPDANGDTLDLRRGYFCISENDPNSGKDDSLSFTVDYRSLNQNCVYKDTSGVRARAVILGPSNTDTYLYQNPNQPEHDDGFPVRNKSGLSNTAEVCYFLRNGNLHRRVMLIREQYDDSGSGTGQPTNNAGTPLITSDYPGTPTRYVPDPNDGISFWRDFDYSAIYDTINSHPYFLVGYSNNPGAVSSSLNNSVTTGFTYNFGGGPVSVPLSLGIPHFRFGHDIADGTQGRPREYLNAYSYNLSAVTPEMSEQNYIGRFTTQETAHATFTYPGNLTNGNPMDWGTVTLNDADNNGVVDEYDGLNRRGDDILLTNVIEFDIKVWDDIRQQFVNLGNSGGGQFDASQNQNPAYGNTYDTWHWFDGLNQPPYRPTTFGPDYYPGDPTVNDDGDTNTDERGDNSESWIGTDDEVPLKAIEITIRYTDPSSGLVRQVTLLNSLLD